MKRFEFIWVAYDSDCCECMDADVRVISLNPPHTTHKRMPSSHKKVLHFSHLVKHRINLPAIFATAERSRDWREYDAQVKEKREQHVSVSLITLRGIFQKLCRHPRGSIPQPYPKSRQPIEMCRHCISGFL
jgi:hypothetical protein